LTATKIRVACAPSPAFVQELAFVLTATTYGPAPATYHHKPATLISYANQLRLSNFHSQKIHKILKNKNLIFFKKYGIILLEK
jgi:hypothetical protein